MFILSDLSTRKWSILLTVKKLRRVFAIFLYLMYFKDASSKLAIVSFSTSKPRLAFWLAPFISAHVLFIRGRRAHWIIIVKYADIRTGVCCKAEMFLAWGIVDWTMHTTRTCSMLVISNWYPTHAQDVSFTNLQRTFPTTDELLLIKTQGHTELSLFRFNSPGFDDERGRSNTQLYFGITAHCLSYLCGLKVSQNAQTFKYSRWTTVILREPLREASEKQIKPILTQ